ncbi:VOC family protein [Nocardioides sp. NPDC047086]|uniref:VOC family protein n=1 Tax=Nocardioides sp. NPDC047086 TaxID=3154810 RepID=UPI0033D8721B
MILACHTLVYSDDPGATRAFFRDVLQLPHIDEGDGWLIFATGPSEMGIHPTGGTHEGRDYSSPRHHQISFICDDIEATKAELEARGAIFDGDVADHGYGLVAMVRVPGADDVQIYQPRHRTAYDS